jgi:hypothetical protein
MQKFEYRTPRYQVDFPVNLSLPNLTIEGRCKEISKEGMKAELPEPVSPQTRGKVTIRHRDFVLDLPVRVAHAGADLHGLVFVFESDKDRAAIERLVALLTDPGAPARPVLVK